MQVIGVAIFTVAAVAGQTSAALLVDKAGIGPAGKQPVTLMRIGAAILGIVGVLVSVLGQDSTGQFAFGAVLISFAAGALVSTQPALNGQIANHTGQPAAARHCRRVAVSIHLRQRHHHPETGRRRDRQGVI